MNKIFSLLLVMAVVLFTTNVFAGATPKGKPFVEIQGQFVEVENSVFDLQAEVDALVTRVDNIEDSVFNLENAITNLENENVILGEQIDTLINAAATNSTEIQNNLALIESNEEQLAILRQDVVSNEFAIHELEHEQEGLYDLIVANADGVLGLQSQIDDNVEVLFELQKQLDEANAAIARKADFMSASCPAGSALRDVDTNTGYYSCSTDLVSDWQFNSLEIQVQDGINELYTMINNHSSQVDFLLQSNTITLGQIADLQTQLSSLADGTEANRANLQNQLNEAWWQIGDNNNGIFNLQGQIDNLQQQINEGITSSSSYGLRVTKVNGILELPAAHTEYSTYGHRHNSFGSYHTHSYPYTVTGKATATITCPEGSLVQGGGINTVPGGVNNVSNYEDGNGWSATGENWAFAPRNVYFYSSCLEVYEK
ncbi:hypothetical protein ACFLZU_05065 [Thermodesulfobacteriota bacterium]